MRTATGLTLVAIGAILAFAIRTSPSFLNLQIAGWVIMLTGAAGMFIPQRGPGLLRRRIVVRRPRATAVDPASGPLSLAPGQVVELHVSFAPAAAGLGEAVLSLSSDDEGLVVDELMANETLQPHNGAMTERAPPR